MDFLDPKAKKQQRVRLMIGYILVAILIVTASTILVYRAYGFNVDRKTGQVTQSGLVYIDSAPDGAELYLNGELYKDKTNSRLSLEEGQYEILIKKSGYRDWSRTLFIRGGTVERITYPLLVLQDLSEQRLASFGAAAPKVSTQSPDRRWLLVSEPGSITNFREYDLNSLDNEDKPKEEVVTFPAGLFTAADGEQLLQVVEWSTDNKNFLVKHTYGTGSEYLILNRDNPAESFSISKLLNVQPDQISLRDKRPDEWYLYTKAGGILQSANKEGNVEAVLANVTAYKTHDMDVIIYAVKTSDTLSTIYIRQNGQTYNLRTVAAGAVKLDIARFDNAWYVVVASDGDTKTYIYKNPVTDLSKREPVKPVAVAVLKANQAINRIGFSTNTRFVMAQDAQHVGVYDAEKSESYQYSLKDTVDKDTPVSWMDGHRLQYKSDGFETIVDFNGSNAQRLVRRDSGSAAFFNRDYTILYVINTQGSDVAESILNSVNIRSKEDR